MDALEFVASITGQLVWSVKRGHGSFLTMEFGDPNLSVREPIVSSAENMPSVTKLLSRRHVSITGTWHLWIQYAGWSIVIGDETCSFDQERASIDAVLEILNGQKVISLDFELRDARLVIKFDLGGVLSIFPRPKQFEPDDIVWSLRKWGSNTVSISQNGSVIVENPAPQPA